MADLTATTIAANYEKFNGFTSIGRTVIVRLEGTNITDAQMQEVVAALADANGSAGALAADSSDAFTVAAMTTFVGATTDDVYLAIQGTGVTTGIKAELEATSGVTTATVVADFDQTFKGAA